MLQYFITQLNQTILKKYRIEKTNLEDLKLLQICHKNVFPNSLSAKLGSKFRIKMLEWYVVQDRGELFHIKENDNIIGYCGGIKTKRTGLGGAASNITQYAFRVFVYSFLKRPWLIFHKETRNKISLVKKNILIKLRLKKLNTEHSKDNIIKFKPFWGLVVIGVPPNSKGKGLGSLLLQHFEILARQDEVSFISLSVLTKNIQAIKAYQKNNWIIVEENSISIRMEKQL